MSTKWLLEAKGSFDRASTGLINDIKNSDKEDLEMSRIINNRKMKVKSFFCAYEAFIKHAT